MPTASTMLTISASENRARSRARRSSVTPSGSRVRASATSRTSASPSSKTSATAIASPIAPICISPMPARRAEALMWAMQ